jgi:thiaminase/transcriptional activator TenA
MPRMALHEELVEIADPVLRKVLDHPFWSGLRDGSLPGESLAHFVQQDTAYLLPAYARALARVAAAAPEDGQALLFGRSIFGTLEAKDKLRTAYQELAPELGTPPLPEDLPADPGTHAHSSLFAAASATSFHARVGALLPMVWFNFQVSNDLKERHTPGSKYAKWIEVYHPGETYSYAVKAFLGMVDRVGASASPAQRNEVTDYFATSIRYEWAFAETNWQRPTWPV